MSKHTQARYEKDLPYQSSHLFLVRVWPEKYVKGTPQARLYGRVQDVSTGQAHYFRDGSELAMLILGMIPQSNVDRPSETARNAEHEDKG